jgi:hypothetical protein
MVNNFEIIRPLLNWRSSDDFYYVQILQRKKDHKDGMKVSGANNNARLIKSYQVKSLDHLTFIEPEIIELCKVFNARAGINLNRRSFEVNHLKLLKKIVQQMENKDFDKAHKAYDSVLGANTQENEKKWIVDVDKDEVTFLNEIKLAVDTSQPYLGISKVWAEIPSKSGVHLITRSFNRAEFPVLLNQILEKYQITMKLDIQPNNPTNLYIP